jgi:drug/metabolite transporter (DMT)-like permease
MTTQEVTPQVYPDSISRPLHLPVLALLLATVFWGMGFTWAKAAGEAINAHAKLPPGAALGPVLLLGVRFSLAAVIWIAVFPAARRGWSGRGLRRGILLGCLLGAGLIAQHLGLDRTSEAVSAFLTNLTVIFVPLLVAMISRKWPAGRLRIAILVAAVGIYLMTGAAPQGFGRGEALGLACSILFAIFIVALDYASVGEDPFRLTAIQFVVVGIICFGVSAVLARGDGRGLKMFIEDRTVLRQALLLTTLTTVAAFGLMMRFQPRIDPTRAALIYLAEPVVAALWAWRRMDLLGIVGAALIVAANVLAGHEGERDIPAGSLSPGTPGDEG